MPSIARIAARIAREGQSVELRRLTGTGPTQAWFAVEAQAFVRGFRAQELVGGIIQGDRQAVISDAELQIRQWPGPPRKGDKLVIDGKQANVESVETRKLRDSIAMHVLQVRG